MKKNFLVFDKDFYFQIGSQHEKKVFGIDHVFSFWIFILEVNMKKLFGIDHEKKLFGIQLGFLFSNWKSS
jgi:hypothetical protein